MKTYRSVGVMSGTSLDGLDVACCEFTQSSMGWRFRIKKAITISYPREWKKNLIVATQLGSLDFIRLHMEYGSYIGQEVKKLLNSASFKAEIICSHGHTIYHQPDRGITFQLGDGAAIASKSGITTVNDFRSLSVALGGQGAPLVPIGDEMLFGNYHYCLNLGGFSNISYRASHKRVAFDIGPANMILNHLAQKEGMDFDKDGAMGSKGNIDEGLLSELNSLEFYAHKPPKSLGREWFESVFLPVIDASDAPAKDVFHTVYEHIAEQIVRSLKTKARKNVLITGGGAFNTYLIELLKSKTRHEIIVPDPYIVKYKEALIFAFLGVLRLRNQVNCLSSVTGSSYDCSGGAIHLII